MATRQVTFRMSSKTRCVDLTPRDLLIRDLATVGVATLVVVATSGFQMAPTLLSSLQLSALFIAILRMILIFKLARIMLTPLIEVDRDQQTGTVAMFAIVIEEAHQSGGVPPDRAVVHPSGVALPVWIDVKTATSLHNRKEGPRRLGGPRCPQHIPVEISLGVLRPCL